MSVMGTSRKVYGQLNITREDGEEGRSEQFAADSKESYPVAFCHVSTFCCTCICLYRRRCYVRAIREKRELEGWRG